MFLGLRSLIYPSRDLATDKAFWAKVLGFEPYFDMSYYVGFNVGGYELGLDPNGHDDGASGPTTYWGVTDMSQATAELFDKGVKQLSAVQNVGEGILMAKFQDASGNAFGIIENPHFNMTS